MTKPRRIDVHHHPSPPSYMASRNNANRFAQPQLEWTVGKSLEDMDRGGVATSILSLPHPVSIWPADRERGRALAREWNEYSATLMHDHPGRFGVFATLPILDIEGSLREIGYALDTLHADGINLITNIGDRWLGDAHYDPVFEELNRRGAVVYTHPAAPSCCDHILPEVNDSVVEYGADTTRAIAKLLFSGAVTRFPRIRFVFSHAGGAMPFLIERFIRAHVSSPKIRGVLPDGPLPELKKMYYDTAQAANPFAMGCLSKVVSTSQIVFGTDFPYRTALDHANGLAECGFSPAELFAIECGNVQRLMPRLAS